ncbi:MAG: hypothetical protein HY796_04140 [Elusimicrobia bacterium]|nr:hypothetical protein [Elusimicrobiota bacterium]
MFAFSLRKFFWGLLVIAAGALIWAHNYGLVAVSFKFSRDWLVFLIVIGLISVWNVLFGRHWWRGRNRAWKDNIPANVRKILEDLESGKISAEDAAKKMGD